jgi:3-dehydroquinate synthetase
MLPQGKNLVGAFYNPSLLLISTEFLNTLSDEEYKSGLGEVAKYALLVIKD